MYMSLVIIGVLHCSSSEIVFRAPKAQPSNSRVLNPGLVVSCPQPPFLYFPQKGFDLEQSETEGIAGELLR